MLVETFVLLSSCQGSSSFGGPLTGLTCSELPGTGWSGLFVEEAPFLEHGNFKQTPNWPNWDVGITCVLDSHSGDFYQLKHQLPGRIGGSRPFAGRENRSYGT